MPRSSPTRRHTFAKPWIGSAAAPSASDDGAAPAIEDGEFAALMDRLGPFEHAPRLAVAVSGGPDSMALSLLAQRWARERGGVALAITVDHALRPESAAEAHAVHGWLAARGIEHAVLRWAGAKPRSGIQAAARAARYRLLTDWCREARILHLLLAHQREDQAETLLLRRERASGPDGLAAMAPVREVAGLRILRPLLNAPRARLAATLVRLGQVWLDDPSNRAPAFTRTRLRAAAERRAAELAAEAAAWGQRRASLDDLAAAWLARAARIHPAGFVLVDWPMLRAVRGPVPERALRQILLALGGGAYPPRRRRLGRLLEELQGGAGAQGRTLGGCRILPLGRDLLFCREAGAIRDVREATSGACLRWDERFSVRIRGAPGAVSVRALGEDGWWGRRRLETDGAAPPLPLPVALALPSLWRGEELIMVPHLRLAAPATRGRLSAEVWFRPRTPLAAPRYAPALTPSLPLLGGPDTLC